MREEWKVLSTLAWRWLLSEAAAGSTRDTLFVASATKNHQPALLPLICLFYVLLPY